MMIIAIICIVVYCVMAWLMTYIYAELERDEKGLDSYQIVLCVIMGAIWPATGLLMPIIMLTFRTEKQ